MLGRDPRTSDIRAKIGAQFHGTNFHPRIRVREAIELVSSFYPDAEPSEATLQRFDIVGLSARFWGELSLGQRQIVLVSLAFAGRPRVLLLDEPLLALDDASRQVVLRRLTEFCSEGGTLVSASHDAAIVQDRERSVRHLGHGRLEPASRHAGLGTSLWDGAAAQR